MQESRVSSKYINNKWVDEEKYEYTYYSNWNILTSSRINFNTNYKIEETYDSNGNKAIYSQYRYINNEWVKIEEWLYVNDSSRIPTIIITLDEDGSFNTKDERTYDENGNTITKVYSEYINNEWVYKSKEENTYSENGNILTSSRIYFKFNYKIEDTYDSNGNKVINSEYRYINNEWVKTRELELINEELKEVYVLILDEEGNPNSKTEITYDEFGNIASEKEYIYQNGEWVEKQ